MERSRLRFLTAVLLLACLRPSTVRCAAGAARDTIRVRSVLVVERGAPGRRSPVFTDAIEMLLVSGDWRAPAAGDSLHTAGGEARVWRRVTADARGWLEDDALRGGYAFATVDAPRDGIFLLDARGHRHVYVNGVPRAGDVYDLGLVRLPIRLRRGRNELLFRAGRGRLRAEILPPPAPLFIEPRDMILPDVIRGEAGETLYAGIIVTNASGTWQSRLALLAAAGGGGERLATTLAPLPPVSSRKMAVAFVAHASAGDSLTLAVDLLNAGTLVDTARVRLAIKEPTEKHVRSFVSDIDGSVQFFGVTPPAVPPDSSIGLVLTLHGANVDAGVQAHVYGARSWAAIVAPTNRRRFGFDWEDWGRMDALEVLEIARDLFHTDPARTWLTGHSMGGHGVWNLGAHFPDRFAALAPSAGWCDFWSYAGAVEQEDGDGIERLLARSANASRTLLLEGNLLHGGVYILHGALDDNVPVTEARAMRERLARFHPNWVYYERPGAGHWWGGECMDWPPLMEFLRRNRRPAPQQLLELEFTTVNPEISARCFWLSIEAQRRSMVPSTVRAAIDPGARSLALETENVARLAFDLAGFAGLPQGGDGAGNGAGGTAAAAGAAAAGGTGESGALLPRGAPIRVTIDDQDLGALPSPVAGTVLRFVRAAADDDAAGGWIPIAAVDPFAKGPHRAGPFKEAFKHRMIFVVGTRGSAAENAWSFAKARYDAETFSYRGNGAVEIVRDADFDPGAAADRNVVLYGNADTNAAWSGVLRDCPVEVWRDHVRVGDREVAGDALACLFTYPRAGSDVASVAVVGGTGLSGCRLTNQLPYFVSGVGYPDWIIIGSEMLEQGAAGVRAAGFFGPGWQLSGDAAWR